MKKGRPDRRPEPPKCPQPTPPKRSFSSPQSRPSAWRARAALRRLDRFRESDILRYVFERVVAGCMVNGLVKGEGFAVDASAMEANVSHYRGNDAWRARGARVRRRRTETPAPDRRERSRGFARAGPEATGSAHSTTGEGDARSRPYRNKVSGAPTPFGMMRSMKSAGARSGSV